MARPQDKNLIPQSHKLSVEEQSKGGKASGEARRRKRDMQANFEAFLSMQANDKYKAALKRKGMDVPDDLTYDQLLAITMATKAIAGDARMASLMLDVLGDRQSDKLKAKEIELKEKAMTDTKNDALNKLDEILRGLHEQAQNDQ